MEMSAVASASTALSNAGTGDAVATLVLKKALEAQQQSAQQLIEALPQPAVNNPPHLGQKVNAFA